MLTPKNRGEGEHSKNKKKRKAPQIALTVLFLSTPVCMAQAATSSFGIASELQPQQGQYQKVSGHLLYNYPNQKNQTRFALATPIITESDISALETTLSQYKAKLATLSTEATDPALQASLDTALANIKAKIADLEAKIAKAKSDLAVYQTAQVNLSKATQDYLAKQSLAKEAQQSVYNKTATRDTAQTNLDQAKALADASLTNLNVVKADVQAKEQALSSADALLTNQINITNNAFSELSTAQINTSNKAQALLEAQQNYDTLLIPDPSWTAPTYQKEHIRVIPETIIVEEVTTTTQQSENILPPLDHTTWSGAGTGAQGSQPTINQGVVKFSYMSQSVSYTKQETLTGTLTLSVDVKNQDANRGIQDTYKIEVITYDLYGIENGRASYNSPQGWHDWTTRSVSVNPNSTVYSYKVILTGLDGGYWYGTYGPEMKNPTLSATTTTTTITYREETIYRYETYYTTEPVLVEGTLDVAINEGQTKTYTAPDGAVFISSSLRYEAKDRPECGINIVPNLQGNSITISASNGVWGDPCGGWYKHIVGTLTYLGQPTAPLINDPALLPPLQEAQLSYNEALTFAQIKADAYAIELDEKGRRVILKNNAEDELSYAITLRNNAQEALDNKQSDLTSAQSALDTANSELATEQQNLQTFQGQESIALATKSQMEASATTAETNLKVSQASAVEASSYDFNKAMSEAQVIADTPEPEPEPEPEGDPNIPEVIEDLMDVELDKVVPTDLTPEQAEQLVEAALETFETATEGSPEYQQALEALAVAAQQDDIVLDESIADIPGVGQAAAAVVAVFNLVGNVGADISPKAREKAQTLVVTTLVVGQIAQTAAMATAAASSSSYRRK